MILIILCIAAYSISMLLTLAGFDVQNKISLICINLLRKKLHSRKVAIYTPVASTKKNHMNYVDGLDLLNGIILLT